MKKILFVLLASGLGLVHSAAQINNYNHAPVIVGHHELFMATGESLNITPDDLIVGDLEEGNYHKYQIALDGGENFSLEGSKILSNPGFNGILRVPCRISDGELWSNTFSLEIIVSEIDQPGRVKAGKSLFVAGEGDDNHPGTLDQPFASLERALKEVRDIRSILYPSGGIEILIREGVYPVNQSIHLDKTLSGEKGSPMVIRAYPGEEVIFEGGSPLDYQAFKKLSTPGIKERILDKEAAEKILEIDLAAQGIGELGEWSRRGYGIRNEELPECALAVDGEIQTISRYPNASYSKQILEVTDTKHAFTTGDTHLRKWKSVENIWLDGSICKPWEWSMNQVESINPETLEIRLKDPEYSEIDSTTPIYHFKNILEEIDMPGEYYIDAGAKKLYYLPTEDFSPSSQIYLTRLKEPMIEIDEEVSDLWLEGIIFENGRSAAIHLRGERNKIRSCEVRCFSQTGITVGGNKHVISASHIHDIGMEGVILNSSRRSSNPMLIPSGNLIINSEISHFSQWHRAYKPGLRIQGTGTGISHCLIHHGPHMGITISGNDHVFEYTDVHHTPEEFSDMLSIYIITGNSPQHRGTVIRRNYFHDVNTKWKQGAGVYLDNETYGVAVHENFFHNSGGEESGWSVMIHGGGDNIVKNNVFVDCVFPFMVSLRLNTYAKDKLQRYLYSWSRTFAQRYPFLDSEKCKHMQRYPELIHFFDDDDGQGPTTPYTFDIQKDEEGEIINYWTRRTPATNVFENNLVYNSPDTPFKMGKEKEGVREIREFYVVNGFRFQDGVLLDQLIHANNHLWKSDPGFKDYLNKDFSIREDAEVLQKIPGLDQIPFEKIGLE